ncbi:MAG: Biopolymer transport protein ExbD/TolR [Deltaproteobacteria bacterium]|nr:Biopolymer transport protein ExbD/TolR [Deltaproteobacteria bacterium]
MAIHSLPSTDEATGDDIVAEINITPLTDIFLVLLIIFMVTTSVISSQGKNVDLPSSAVASQTPAGVTVTLTAEDEVAIDGAVVAGDAIAPALKAALDKAKDKVVVLRGDRAVVLGRAVSILDMAQEAGATGIALATKPPGPGEK